VGRELAQRCGLGVLDHEVPDGFLVGERRARQLAALRDGTKEPTLYSSAASTHSSMRTLTHDGTGTVRRRIPFPTKSGMTQRPSRC
jgi:hypothetical protein